MNTARSYLGSAGVTNAAIGFGGSIPLIQQQLKHMMVQLGHQVEVCL
jgi:hypothetical protein